jgi:hypothetical protein
MRALRVLVIVCTLGLTMVGCGGSSSTAPSPSPAMTTITLSATGVTPAQVTIAPGDRVLFVNADSRSHDMEWDPHPDHQGPCGLAGVNPPGFLAPGQRRETGNLVNVQSCGFHDHNDPPPGGNRWTGTILIR